MPLTEILTEKSSVICDYHQYIARQCLSMGCVTSSEDTQPEEDTHDLKRSDKALSESKGSSKTPKSARWKIFNAIDYRDERERLEFARFVRSVKDALDKPDSELRSSKEFVSSIGSELSEMDGGKGSVEVDRVMVEKGVRLPEDFGHDDCEALIKDLKVSTQGGSELERADGGSGGESDHPSHRQRHHPAGYASAPG